MKKLRKLFKKKEIPTDGVIVGITDAEYLRIHDKLSAELEAAKARQKPTSEKPSGYMRGLEFAIYTLETIKPHVLQGVKYGK